MKALNRMRWRDLWWLRGQVLATALVVLCGIASFVATFGTWQALRDAQQHYYRQQRFADVFVSMKRAPLSLVAELASEPGVRAVEGRLSTEVLIDSDSALLISARIVSLPPAQPAVNAVFLRSGRWPRADRQAEVLVSETFARAQGWKPGDEVSLILNGRRERVRISGIALAPEFIYEVGPGALLPDAQRYGVMWMPYARLAPALGMQGAINELLLAAENTTVSTADNAGGSAADNAADNAAIPALIAMLDARLQRYGSVGAYARDEHASHQFIRDEISQNRIHSTLVPGIFLAVAAFLLHVALSRLISLQRGEIGLLKAFGYRNRDIARHYFLIALSITLLGTLPGILSGVWLGDGLTRLYDDYYHFPQLHYQLRADNLLIALLISVLSAAAGAWLPVRRAVGLPPAEAMQPEAPAIFRVSSDTRWMQWLRSPLLNMSLRHLLRRRVRSFLSLLAAAVAMAILVLGGYGFDAMSLLMREQFEEINREDVMLLLREPRAATALQDIRRLPGVLAVETFRSIPVHLRHGHRQKRLALTVMSAHSDMRVWRDDQGNRQRISEDGITLGRALADQLQVRAGDRIDVAVLEGQRQTQQVTVTRISDEWLGLGAYVSPRTGQSLLRSVPSISGAWLRIDAAAWPALTLRLRELPWLASSTRKADVRSSMAAMLDRSVRVVTVFNILFAGAIAFGIVYNNLRIALSERGRELASLRVLGFTQQEVLRILLTEQLIILLLALPLGAVMGYGLSAWISERLVTDAYRLPLMIETGSYFSAGGVIMTAAMLSAISVGRRLKTMKIVDVLKTRE